MKTYYHLCNGTTTSFTEDSIITSSPYQLTEYGKDLLRKMGEKKFMEYVNDLLEHDEIKELECIFKDFKP